jgi:hypothetical protein
LIIDLNTFFNIDIKNLIDTKGLQIENSKNLKTWFLKKYLVFLRREILDF